MHTCATPPRAVLAQAARTGDHVGMNRLPVRTGADVHLADAFARRGCPLCRERVRAEAAYLDGILAESVNDVAFRAALDAGRGLCTRHARVIHDLDQRASGGLGAAILLRATLSVRLRELEAIGAAAGRARGRRAAEALQPPRCPACVRVRSTDAAVADSLVGLAEDDRWAAAVGGAPFCLDHVLALVARRSVPPWWAPVETRLLERLRTLRDRLDAFAQATAHDRRHLQTDDQRASVGEAAELLAGDGVPGGR